MTKKPRIVIVGAGMAGLAAANKLYTSTSSNDLFELVVVKPDSPKLLGKSMHLSLTSHGSSWMGSRMSLKTVAEGGFELNASFIDPVSTLFKNLVDFAQGKMVQVARGEDASYYNFAAKAALNATVGLATKVSVRSLDKASMLIGILASTVTSSVDMRTYTSAGDLFNLDFEAEREYRMSPGEEITISKGYLSVIEHLASVLPRVIQLGRKVSRIEWQPESRKSIEIPNGYDYSSRLVKIHFCDGSVVLADHVIGTVSLGLLKAGTGQDSGKEALELETLTDEEIINGVSATVAGLLPAPKPHKEVKHSSPELCNGSASEDGEDLSSGAYLDTMAGPLPKIGSSELDQGLHYPLQILFAGKATHRTHYSTTHGAYFSGLREANRLLQHYSCVGD
ncbi:Beta-galactosidase-like protein [Hibiscus syriacus]|uniref:Beta-galactosidase-like protein n=1 Tax=Hibiscus syriacus TaxID=106335 RepID=A0A6A3A877_HIBSY|nr:Beta-galactosidase-like protein [Hibiscus syriacus]